MYGTADGVDPDKAQHTGADHGDQSRCQGMAKATHGTAADLVSGGQKFQCGDKKAANEWLKAVTAYNEKFIVRKGA